jgi:hypothetical protein
VAIERGADFGIIDARKIPDPFDKLPIEPLRASWRHVVTHLPATCKHAPRNPKQTPKACALEPDDRIRQGNTQVESRGIDAVEIQRSPATAALTLSR